MTTPTVKEMVKASQSEGNAVVNLGAGTAVGDVIYCFQTENFDTLAEMTSPVLGTGGTWTKQAEVDKGSDLPHMQLWTISMTVGGANTVTVNDEGDPSEVYQITYVISGVGTINDGFATRVEPSSGTTLVIPSLTPGGSDDLLLAAYYAHPSATNWTIPGTMTNGTEEETAGFGTMGSAREVLASNSATGTRTFTCANTRTNRIGIMVAIAGATATKAPASPSGRYRRSMLIR